MIRTSYSTALSVFLTVAAFSAARLHAQPPVESAAPAVQPSAPASDDDDAKLRPLEPDFSLVNLPTTLPLPVHAGNFHLTHRFNENLRLDSFGTQASNLFGLDEGATIQLEYRVGVMKHLEAIASRTNVNRTIQLSAKYDVLHESASHAFGISGIVSVEGSNNFQENYAPTLGVVVSRTVAEVAAVYATPMWAHNTFPGTGIVRDTFYLGLGTRIRIVPSLFVVVEGSPRLSGYAAGDAEYAFALEKRVGAHVFAVTFANTSATTYGQIARGGNPQALYLGFNLARKFF